MLAGSPSFRYLYPPATDEEFLSRDHPIDIVDLIVAIGGWGATGAQCESFETIHHLRRRCYAARRGLRPRGADQGQFARAVAAA